MKAILVRQTRDFGWCDRPMPEPLPGEALVRVVVTGLCRTDLKIIEHGHRDLALPRVPGEEVAGIVEAVGCEADPAWRLRRVYVYPGLWCGVCRPCRQGAENLCARMRIMGFHRDGGFAEYVTVPMQSLIEIPEGMPFEHAVFAEPLSCCLNALELARAGAGDRVGIWGGGPAGTLLARAAEALGAEAVVVEPNAHRRSFSRNATVDPPAGMDVCIVAVGTPDAYHAALASLGKQGRLVVFSGLLPPDAVQSVNLNQLHYLEQTVVGAYGCCLRHGIQAIRWIDRNTVRVADLITHRFPLDCLNEALDVVRSRQGMKVLLYPPAPPAVGG